MSGFKDNTKTGVRRHLNSKEREIIERLLREGSNKGEIARLLHRDKSTIKREIKRGTVQQKKRNPTVSKKPGHPEYVEYRAYFADFGQRIYEENRSRCGRKNKIVQCSKMVTFVENKILSELKWSPDASIGFANQNGLFEETFCTKTFYNWIDDGLVKIKNLDLLLKVRHRAKKPRRERKKTLGKSIDERPEAASTRQEFGHWEGDGIVGKDHHGHLITLVERKYGVGFLFNAKSKEPEKIVAVFDKLEHQYGKAFRAIFKSVTFDNGMEFSSCAEMEHNGRTNVYYAHPYSSFERGTNENWNGIVRRFLPKKTSFDSISEEMLNRIAFYINTLPRKRFGYKTPIQMWETEMKAIIQESQAGALSQNAPENTEQK